MLPTISPAFQWTDEAWGAGLRCCPLSEIARHVFTTKQLGLRGAPAVSAREWALVAASVGAASERVMRVRQVHGRVVRVLERGRQADAAERPDGDAVVSNVPGLALAVLVADCVPVLLADPEAGVAAAIHAGWRGTCAGVVEAAVTAMTERFGTRPADLTAAIGPSIGACCYEVGGEVREAFLAAAAPDLDPRRWFHTEMREDGSPSLRLDLWTAVADQLAAVGVPRARIVRSDLCTRTHADVLESFRAEGEAAGRMAAVVVVPGA